MEMSIEKMLEIATFDGFIECPHCGNKIEPDGPKCGRCGWKNPLIEMGFI